ncbi:MAG: hypothetical protein JSS91_09760 [Bacteroidetes bacterium]|nr:hypothetical protein [Bacteroidota bacterium]
MKSADTKFYIGADSGGTKIDLVLVNESGKITGNIKFKGIHYSVAGPVDYSDKVSAIIRKAVSGKGLKLKNCLGICIGIAGAREKKDRNKLRKLFIRNLSVRNTLISTDALTALYGAFEGRNGIILISGTGSVLYGLYDGRIIRVGGWGRVIGDEGGGYWIGKKALNALAKEFDTAEIIKKESSLSREINSEFGINRMNLNDMVFKNNFGIQKIAPLVLKLAEEGSTVCSNIISEAAGDLIYHVKTFLKIAEPEEVIDISFIGSLVENDNILSRTLKKEMLKLKKISVVEKKHSPAYGAYLLLTDNSNLIKLL